MNTKQIETIIHSFQCGVRGTPEELSYGSEPLEGHPTDFLSAAQGHSVYPADRKVSRQNHFAIWMFDYFVGQQAFSAKAYKAWAEFVGAAADPGYLSTEAGSERARKELDYLLGVAKTIASETMRAIWPGGSTQVVCPTDYKLSSDKGGSVFNYVLPPDREVQSNAALYRWGHWTYNAEMGYISYGGPVGRTIAVSGREGLRRHGKAIGIFGDFRVTSFSDQYPPVNAPGAEQLFALFRNFRHELTPGDKTKANSLIQKVNDNGLANVITALKLDPMLIPFAVLCEGLKMLGKTASLALSPLILEVFKALDRLALLLAFPMHETHHVDISKYATKEARAQVVAEKKRAVFASIGLDDKDIAKLSIGDDLRAAESTDDMRLMEEATQALQKMLDAYDGASDSDGAFEAALQTLVAWLHRMHPLLTDSERRRLAGIAMALCAMTAGLELGVNVMTTLSILRYSKMLGPNDFGSVLELNRANAARFAFQDVAGGALAAAQRQAGKITSYEYRESRKTTASAPATVVKPAIKAIAPPATTTVAPPASNVADI